jgi:hypothetical protein
MLKNGLKRSNALPAYFHKPQPNPAYRLAEKRSSLNVTRNAGRDAQDDSHF